MKSKKFEDSLCEVWTKTFEKIPPHIDTVVYQTLYPRFFNPDTPWCDDQDMGLLFHPKLTRELRTKLNLLGMEFNWKMGEILYRFRDESPDNPRLYMGRLYAVSGDSGFDGHRFCEPGVEKPDFKDDSIWLFALGADDASAKKGRKSSF